MVRCGLADANYVEREHAAKNEDGYILITAALLMIPLMIFAALSTDVGAWVVQANRAQNAADAAALAGAIYLPSEQHAFDAASQVAEMNGFVDGVDGASVDMEITDTGALRVEIGDQSDLFFSSVVLDDQIALTRAAEAEGLPPIGMGSPTNVLGFGPYSLDGSEVSRYWLAEGNDCIAPHHGDIKGARYETAGFCSSGVNPNPRWKRATDGRKGGYFYVVTVPPGMTQSSRLMVLDPGLCPPYGSKYGEKNTTLSFRQWSSSGTAVASDDDVPVTGWWQSDDCLEDLPYPSTAWVDQTQGWTETPFVFPPNTTGEPETHLIQTMVGDATRKGMNYYAFWVRPDGGGTSCTTIGTDSCATIGAEDWVSISGRGDVPGQPADIYLAEVGPENQGLTLDVSIWDVGEGMRSIQVLDPNGEPLDFTWESDDPTYGMNNPSNACSGKPCLRLYPNNKSFPPKKPGWGLSWKFSGRLVTLSVPLDTQVDYTSYDDYWFQVRYNPPSGDLASDLASFSVSLGGAPVRLVD